MNTMLTEAESAEQQTQHIRFRNVAGSLAYLLVSLVFFWGEFAGMYHAFGRHGSGDGIISIVLPPYAWYRSVELFWHDRHTDEQWCTILSDDALGILTLVPALDKDPEVAIKRNQLITELRARFKRYPASRKQQLRDIVDAASEYSYQCSREALAQPLHLASNTAELEAARERVLRCCSQELVRYLDDAKREINNAAEGIAKQMKTAKLSKDVARRILEDGAAAAKRNADALLDRVLN